MSCHPRVTEWSTIIPTHLPHLSKPQATVVALWSLGMVLARSCALTAVSACGGTGLWWQGGEDQPGILVARFPARQQGAVALALTAFEGDACARPPRVRLGH